MLGKGVVAIGGILAVYSVLASNSLLLVLSLALMFSGVLWEYKLQLEEQQELLTQIGGPASKGLGSWRVTENEYRINQLEDALTKKEKK
ncbi:MAG: hypothetical protein ABH950_01340 [Candidatus Altiarchaeota archaeon]